MSLVRVLTAHNGLMRLSVRMALEAEAEICAEAADAEAAILEAQRCQPDVCLIGWDIAGQALTAIQGILTVAPRTAVIVLSERSDVDDLLAAVRAGAVGYLPGSLDEEQLRRVVRGVAAEEAAVPRSMVRDLILELRTATALGGITEREAQVLGMLRRGHSTAEIAARLQISPVTVRRYISDLMRKLGVESRSELLDLDPAAKRTTACPGEEPPRGAHRDGARLGDGSGDMNSRLIRRPGSRGSSVARAGQTRPLRTA